MIVSNLEFGDFRAKSLISRVKVVLKTAVVLFVKDEISDIAFWIAWHLRCGFDAIIVYDDYSSDGTWELITQAAKELDIRCHRAIAGDQFNLRQRNTYMDALDTFRDEFDWLLFLDADEYLQIQHGQNVKTFLAGYPEAHGIAINWCCYGSNNHVIKPPSPNVFRNYTSRSQVDFEYNHVVKSFVATAFTKSNYINPHRFDVEGPYVTTDKKPVSWMEEHPERTVTLAQWDVARVNHYIIRSAHHYLEKMKRRVDIRNSGLGLKLFSYCDRNDQYSTLPPSEIDPVYDQLYKIQSAVNRSILERMIATCGKGLNGRILRSRRAEFGKYQIGQLRTFHGTVVGYDGNSCKLTHDRADGTESRAFQPALAITLSSLPDFVFIASNLMNTPLHAEWDPRVSIVLPFKCQHLNHKDFYLRNPVTGLVAAFMPTPFEGAKVEINRSHAHEWECLTFETLAEDDVEYDVSMVKNFVSIVQSLENPSYLCANDLTETIVDSYIAGLQTLSKHEQEYFCVVNRLPPYPWLKFDDPLSV